TLITRRQFRLKLISDCFRDLALNGENISKIAIVSLCPEMGVVPRINQLRIYAHTIVCSLHATLEQMYHAELSSNFAEIAPHLALVLHHAGTADDLEVGDLSQIRQDFVLHSVGEKGVVWIAAQIVERQDSDAFLRNSRRGRHWSRRRKGRRCSSTT